MSNPGLWVFTSWTSSRPVSPLFKQVHTALPARNGSIWARVADAGLVQRSEEACVVTAQRSRRRVAIRRRGEADHGGNAD